MPLTRREFLKAGAAGGALLFGGPSGSLLAAEPTAFPTSRQSRLFPGNGTFAVHSDLHNHSLLSDGATAAEEVFSRMRSVQLDVAALTDHALFGKAAGKPCSNAQCNYYLGIDEPSWQKIAQIANANNADGSFVAMRGFEWTTGTIGHVNVWFSEQWIDSFTTLGLQSPKGLTPLFGVLPSPIAPDPEVVATLTPLIDQLPETATMDLFYQWLQTRPGGGPLGGGADGLAGFNHPNEFGNFQNFRFVPGVRDRIVSCEALNMDRDFLFFGAADDPPQPSPLNACLNAGWRVGMLGVSDEHFDKWGQGRARGGLWVKELTRAGVREAMEARRMYATFQPGLRLDVAANGIQMGQSVPHTAGPLRIDIDIDAGPALHGRDLNVQILRPGKDAPVVADSFDIEPPVPVLARTIEAKLDEGSWVMVRVTDRAQPADKGTPAPFQALGRALAYASPFFLVPGQTPVPPASTGAAAGDRRDARSGGSLPATGGTGPAALLGAAAVAAAVAARRARHTHDHDH